MQSGWVPMSVLSSEVKEEWILVMLSSLAIGLVASAGTKTESSSMSS